MRGLKELPHSCFSFLLQISSEPFSVKDYQLIQYLIPVPVSLRPLFAGWKTYNGKKRYFTFSEDHEYAYMKEGLNFINGVPMYFDNSGYLVTSEIEDETAIKKMGSYYYAVDCCGEVTIDDWEEIDDSFYYFDRKGRMLRNGKYKINGDYYLFDTDGIMYAGDLGIEFYDFKSNTYAVRTDGTLVSGKCGKIDGKEYYFDSKGIAATGELKLGLEKCKFSESGELLSKEKTEIDPGKPMVALTFDDGPGPRTSEILDQLKKYNAHATFFMLGKNVKSYPDAVKQMLKDGNELGNHSYDHQQLTKIDAEAIAKEVNDTNENIKNICGSPATVLSAETYFLLSALSYPFIGLYNAGAQGS